MQIQFLKAEHGDSILITITEDNGKNRNILIDGGTYNTYAAPKSKKGPEEEPALKAAIGDIRGKKENIDLLILSHVDNDHIGGLLRWFEDDKEATSLVKEVWFNSGKMISRYFDAEEIAENDIEISPESGSATGIPQGVSFAGLLEGKGILCPDVIQSLMCIERFGATFRILSPNKAKLQALLNKWEREAPDSLTATETDYHLSLEELAEDMSFAEDPEVHNGSSLSFILEYKDKSYVFLADSHSSVIVESLTALEYTREKPLEAALVKVSHHASRRNTSYELLSLIRCEEYVVSTDGSRHGHPNKKALSRIINANANREIPCSIYFNYPELITKIFTEEDYLAYPFFKALSTDSKSEY